MMQVVWEGNWFAPNGHATVCRNMVRALAGRGIDVRLQSPVEYDIRQFPDFADEDLLAMANRAIALPEHTVRIIHRIPTEFERGRERLTIGMTYTEATSMPAEWVDAVNTQVDALILPSRQAAEVARNAGVERPVWVVPQGVDVHTFRPRQQGEPDPFDWPPFRFLSVFEWVPRKGYDVLMNAYWDEFCNRDDVCLVIKTRYFSQGSVPGGASSTLEELQYLYRTYQQSRGTAVDPSPVKKTSKAVARRNAKGTGKRLGWRAVNHTGKALGRKAVRTTGTTKGRTGATSTGTSTGRRAVKTTGTVKCPKCRTRATSTAPAKGRTRIKNVGKALGRAGAQVASKAVGRSAAKAAAIRGGRTLSRSSGGQARKTNPWGRNTRGNAPARRQASKSQHTGIKRPTIHHGPRQPVNAFVRFAPDDKAPIYLYDGMLSDAKLAELYRFCSAFVLPTHGEGIGLPLLEAAATGLPLIVTGWGGQMDFIRAEEAYIVAYTVGEVPQQLQSTWPSLHGGAWANPGLDSIRGQMRSLYASRHEVSQKAVRQQQHVITHWNWNACAAHLIAHLEGALGQKLS